MGLAMASNQYDLIERVINRTFAGADQQIEFVLRQLGILVRALSRDIGDTQAKTLTGLRASFAVGNLEQAVPLLARRHR